MELAVIAPISRLEDTTNQQFHMVLPQLLGNDTYRHFYTSLPLDKHVILDNGEAEGEKVKPRDLIKCAELVNVNEIVVPDAMGDTAETMARVIKFERTARKHPQFNYVGVVQGKDFAEVAKMVIWYAATDWINILALPRWLTNHVDRDMRTTVMRGLGQAVRDGFDAVHCLGAAQWFREVVPLSEWPVRSIDTSLPHVMALANRSVVTGDYVARQPKFFWTDLSKVQQDLARSNMHYFETWCRGPNSKRQELKYS